MLNKSEVGTAPVGSESLLLRSVQKKVKHTTSVRLHRLIGEIERLHDYAEKGDIAHVPLTHSVYDAFLKMRELL
jgi:hypothetical protein